MMAYMGPVFGLLKGDHEDASGEGEVWAAFNEGAAEIASNFRLNAKSNQDLLGKLLAMVGIKRSRKKRSDQSWAYSLDTDHWTVWKSFVQAGNAVVEGVRETVKKIQAACATSRAALGMVAYEVVNKLVAMVLPERPAEVVEEDEQEEWSDEVEVEASAVEAVDAVMTYMDFQSLPPLYTDLEGEYWLKIGAGHSVLEEHPDEFGWRYLHISKDMFDEYAVKIKQRMHRLAVAIAQPPAPVNRVRLVDGVEQLVLPDATSFAMIR
jgi:hypothetical protein